MAYTVAVVVDGECVCSLCCERVWHSLYDCDSMTWGTPTLTSQQVVAGPCPSDVDWAYDGSTGNPCDAVYIQYTPIEDVCKDCDSITPVPPSPPVLPPPSECCDDSYCWYVWAAEPDCEDNTWAAVNVIAGPFCDPVGSIGFPINTWFVDPFWGTSCPVYVQVTATSCTDMGDCPGSPGSPPVPPEPPNPPAFYEGCCPIGCCVTWIVDGGDCFENTWNAPTVSSKVCSIEGECQPGWINVIGCVWAYSVWTAGPCVDPDEDCPDGDPPPSTPPGLPQDYTDCCGCCFYLYEASYDCDTEMWTVAQVTVDCLACDDDEPFGIPGSVNTWVVSGDPCVYYQAVKPGTFCEAGDDCEPISPPSPPLGGDEPPGCCDDECCVTLWTSVYTCPTEEDPGFWSEPTIFSQDSAGPCDVAQDWTSPGPFGSCSAFLIQVTASSNCPEEGEYPSTPSGTPPGCCECCWYWEALYNCETEAWTPPSGTPGTSMGSFPGECPEPTDTWVKVDDTGVICTYTYSVTDPTCEEEPTAPNVPVADPEDCCDPCTECESATPTATVTGNSGSVPCSIAAHDPMVFTPIAPVGTCEWRYEYSDAPNNNRWTLVVTYGGGQWNVYLQVQNNTNTFLFASWQNTDANFDCSGGAITGSDSVTQIPFPGGGNCSGAVPTPLTVTLS